MGKNDPLKNKNGVTMVEMIVVFALISIFVAMSGQVIGSAMNIYHRIQGVEYGRQVSDTIMNKIVGELSGAQVASAQYDASGATDPYTIKIDSANSSIEFRDEGGSLVKIYSGRPQNYTYNDAADTEIAAGYDSGNPANWDHQLVIHYYVTKGATGETVYQPVDWTFDKSMYHGYEIQSLNFSRADYAEYPWHIIRVDLKLKSNTYGEYETTRYVECYHFRNNPDKILEEGNPLPVTPAPVPSSTPVPEPDPSATPGPEPTAAPTPPPAQNVIPTAAPTPTPLPVMTPPPDNSFSDGTGHVQDNDGSLTFVPGEYTFQDLLDSFAGYASDNYTKSVLPKGIYSETVDGKVVYYICVSDRWVNQYEVPFADMEAYINSNTAQGTCYRVNASYLFTDESVITPSEATGWKVWKDGIVPDQGSIIHWKGRYYLCANSSGGWVNSPDASPGNWVDITEFFK